jgi:hypothetical protein
VDAGAGRGGLHGVARGDEEGTWPGIVGGEDQVSFDLHQRERRSDLIGGAFGGALDGVGAGRLAGPFRGAADPSPIGWAVAAMMVSGPTRRGSEPPPRI